MLFFRKPSCCTPQGDVSNNPTRAGWISAGLLCWCRLHSSHSPQPILSPPSLQVVCTPKIPAAPRTKGAVIADPAVRRSPQYNLEAGKQPDNVYHCGAEELSGAACLIPPWKGPEGAPRTCELGSLLAQRFPPSAFQSQRLGFSKALAEGSGVLAATGLLAERLLL